MSDITDVFTRVAPDPADPAAATVDADIARGHRALQQLNRRRRVRRSMIAATSVAAAGVLVVVATQVNDGSSRAHHTNAVNKSITPSVAKHPGKVHQPTHKTTPIKLVAYKGAQLHGFTVDKVPAGWFLSTSTQFSLLIDPDGSTDNDPGAFVGKLAVLTQSKDQHGLGKGTPVTVDGEDGVISQQGKYGLNLVYNNPSGIGIDIQAPTQLHWTDQQLVDFAEGVHETGHVIQSVG